MPRAYEDLGLLFTPKNFPPEFVGEFRWNSLLGEHTCKVHCVALHLDAASARLGSWETARGTAVGGSAVRTDPATRGWTARRRGAGRAVDPALLDSPEMVRTLQGGEGGDCERSGEKGLWAVLLASPEMVGLGSWNWQEQL